MVAWVFARFFFELIGIAEPSCIEMVDWKRQKRFKRFFKSKMLRADHIFEFKGKLFADKRDVDDFARSPSGSMKNKIAFFHMGEKLEVANAALETLPIAQADEADFIVKQRIVRISDLSNIAWRDRRALRCWSFPNRRSSRERIVSEFWFFDFSPQS